MYTTSATPQVIHTRKQADSQRYYNLLIMCIITAGILIRCYHFFYNRSLWEDEIYLSAGIITKSFSQLLTQPLPYLQKAPLAYLLITHAEVAMFGNNEKILRLYPLVCGICSFFVLRNIARRYLKLPGVAVALAVYAFAPPLIYHSVEAKPYVTELLASLLVMNWYIKYAHGHDLKKYLTWAALGAMVVWFAYTAIFVLAATAITAAVVILKQKDWKAFWRLTVVGTIWLISFAINYIFFAREGSNSGWLVDFWAKHDSYMPLSAGAAPWLLHKLFSFINYPLGLSWSNNWDEHNPLMQIIARLAFVPALLLIAGVVSLFRKNREVLLLTAAVLLIAIMASALKMYPMHERLMVYLAPFAILLLAAGAEFLLNQRYWLPGAALAAVLVICPLKNTAVQAVHPFYFGDYKKSYQREALLYLNDHYRAGDVVYVYWNDLPGYIVYRDIYQFRFSAIQGKDYRKVSGDFSNYMHNLENDFEAFKGKPRVWIVHHNHIDIPVGDYIGQPVWYYQQHQGIEKFHNWYEQKGVEKAHFEPTEDYAVSDINVSLMDFSNTR